MADYDAELLNDSLERCMRAPEFLDRFYELYLSSSPEVAAKFQGTDFKKQKTALKASLYIMLMANERQAEWTAHLERLARRHSRKELDIRPELYDLWLECLLQTVREFDPRFNAKTETAWRNRLRPGIEFMKSRY
jgi:hemoglobin-like flavoprotein